MATWKKVVVSGSNVSQLNNDAGYLTSATVIARNAFATASFSGTSLLADSPSGSLLFASGAGQGLTISANAGTDTLTFGLAAVPNSSLSASAITIAGTSTSLGGSITAATILSGTGVFSGSAQVTGLTNANLSGTAGITNANLLNSGSIIGSTVVNLGTTVTTLSGLATVSSTAFSGSFSGSHFGPLTGTASYATQALSASFASTAPYSGLTGVPSGIVSGSSQVIALLPAGTVSGSSQVSYTGLSNIPSGIVSGSSQVAALLPTGTVSGSSLSSPSQGNAILTTNGVAGSTIGLGLTTSDSPTFTNLNLSGDLTVLGTTTTIQTNNLLVEDQFILVSSGSANNSTDGGIVVDRGAYAAGNTALGYDATSFRWGLQNGLADPTNTVDLGAASGGVSGSFLAHVFTEAVHGATKPTTGEFAVAGAIYTATNEDIFIYS